MIDLLPITFISLQQMRSLDLEFQAGLDKIYCPHTYYEYSPNETRGSPIAVQFDLVGVRRRLACVSGDTVMIGLADIPSYAPLLTLL